jgi:hypothetical protein
MPALTRRRDPDARRESGGGKAGGSVAGGWESVELVLALKWAIHL